MVNMSQIISVQFRSGNQDIAFDDFAEFDKPTKMLNASTVRWKVPNPSLYLNSIVTIEGKFQSDNSTFINDMKFTQSADNFTKCAFKGS
jgi:hypothetical protein